RAARGGGDAVVRGAAAEVAVQRGLDVAIARPRVAVEQRLGRHHHAVAAVTALAGLLLDERALEWVRSEARRGRAGEGWGGRGESRRAGAGRARTPLRRRALHGGDDAVVRGAAAEVAVQRGLDVAIARPRVAVEQRLGRHHHAVAAVTALAGLLLDERALEWVEAVERAEPLDRRDAALRHAGHRGHARAHGLAVHQHRAGAALREPAAELRAVQLEVVAQYIEEGSVGVDRDRLALAVDLKSE